MVSTGMDFEDEIARQSFVELAALSVDMQLLAVSKDQSRVHWYLA